MGRHAPLPDLPEGDPTPEAPAGRPDRWSPEAKEAAFAKILRLTATTADGIRAICTDNTDLPTRTTFYEWILDDDDYADRYARAKMSQTLVIEEHLDEIASDGTNDWMERRNQEGEIVGWKENGEALGRSRLRVDTIKWRLSKLRPKKYGEFVRTEITGEDGGAVKTDNTLRILFVEGAQAENTGVEREIP